MSFRNYHLPLVGRSECETFRVGGRSMRLLSNE